LGKRAIFDASCTGFLGLGLTRQKKSKLVLLAEVGPKTCPTATYRRRRYSSVDRFDTPIKAGVCEVSDRPIGLSGGVLKFDEIVTDPVNSPRDFWERKICIL